jgi:secreted trypsin-like serine protease
VRLHRIATAAAVAWLWLGLSGVAIPASAADHSPIAHSSIIGGHSASIGEFPWLADIEGKEPGGGFFGCTGTVVAPRVILTAGHCVEDIATLAIYPASGYAVATGVADISQVHRQDISLVSQAVIYPGFSPFTLHGDAGILILTAPVTAPALPLASASDSALLQVRTPISIAGWGVTSSGAKEPPAELQSASTVIQSSRYCKQRSARYYPFYSSATQLCTVDPPRYAVSTCHGDSGGPAIARRADGSPVEVGITSLVGPGCSASLPNIFTRVDQVSPWVASWIAAVEYGGPAPAVTISKAHLPKLSFPRAKYLSGLGLAEDFGYRFRRGIEKRIGCVRIEREKVKCGVSWYQGGNDYYGTITVYFAIYHNTVVWNERYKIHWVDDHCWFLSGHRQTCVIRTQTR